jgi:hypothetical protein
MTDSYSIRRGSIILKRAKYLTYFLGAIVVAIYLSQMHKIAIEYTEDNSIPMASFVRVQQWLSDNLHAGEIALVPHPAVFYALTPELKFSLAGYKTIWDSAGVILQANTTDREIMKVRQNLIEFIEKNEKLRYLVLDWFYDYSSRIFKTRSCNDLGDTLIQIKSFDFVQPHSGWSNKMTICEPASRMNLTAFFSDNFNDNKIDSSRWLTSLVGNGPTVKETNQRLEIVIPSNSLIRTSNSSEVIAGITSTCQLRGDFDFQIDYELLSWPPSNGVFVVLTAQRESVAEKHLKSFQNTERMSLPHLPRDVYATDFDDGLYKVNATSDMSGKLRIVRSGFTITGFYYISDHWVPINSAREGAHADINIKPIAYTKHGLFANKQVKIAFDNAILNKGHLVNCRPK